MANDCVSSSCLKSTTVVTSQSTERAFVCACVRKQCVEYANREILAELRTESVKY